MPGLIDSMRYKADQAALEADKLMRIRREQAAIDQLRRQVRVQMDALGQAAFAAYRNGEVAHPQLVAIGRQIDALTEQIAQHEARIEQIRAEKLAPPPPPVPPPPGPTVACPHCGQRVPAQAAFCPHCGFQMPKLPPAAAVCASCGSSLPAGAQFCPVCGARQAPATPPPPPPPQTIRCSGCGAELPAVAVFCHECGMRVSGTVSYAPPPEPASTAWRPPEPRESPAPAPTPWTSPEAAAPPDLESDVEPWSDADQASAAVVSVAATKRCPVCETELLAEAAFCPECGTRQEGVG